MSAIKEKISIWPIVWFDVWVSTMIDKSKYEIVYINLHRKDIKEKYWKKVYGNWCLPLKVMVAHGEQLIVEEKVEKIIGLGIQTCHYPFVLGNPEKWIDKKVKYYPIESPNLCVDFVFFYYSYKQLRNALPEVNLFNFLLKFPLANYRSYLAHKMYNILLSYLPLTKDPKKTKLVYEEYNKKLIEVDWYKNSKNVFKEFKSIFDKMKVREKSKHKILLTGDFSLFIMEFTLFEIDVFLAKHGIEIVQPFKPFTSAYLVKFSKAMKKAKKLLQKVFSNTYNLMKTRDRFVVENITLAQIVKGLEEDIEWIIYIKPLMCAPWDNISYVLKKEKYFNLPFVEISYDEHTGINWMMTRLEAFINIVEERKK